MKTELDQIPSPESAPEETEIFELIQALLQNGGKTEGHEWINDPEGGYFLIIVQNGDQFYFFKLQTPLPFILGPDGQIR